MNRISWGPKRVVKGRRGESISVGDPSEFLRDLSKKPGGHVGGIRHEGLVAVNEKCSHRRRENACLENVANVSGVAITDEPGCVDRTYMRIPSISFFQRSAIARSCSEACEILRAHIFAEGSSPPGKLGAAAIYKNKNLKVR